MGVSLGGLSVQEYRHVVLEFVKIESLFNQDGTANQDQIIEQSRKQVLSVSLSFV